MAHQPVQCFDASVIAIGVDLLPVSGLCPLICLAPIGRLAHGKRKGRQAPPVVLAPGIMVISEFIGAEDAMDGSATNAQQDLSGVRQRR